MNPNAPLPDNAPWWIQTVYTAIRDLGFPIVIAGYLIVRLDGQVQELIAQNAAVLSQLAHYMTTAGGK